MTSPPASKTRTPDVALAASLGQLLRPGLLAFVVTRFLLALTVLAAPPLASWPSSVAELMPWKTSPTGHAYLHHPSRLLDATVRHDGTFYLQIAALGYAPPASLRSVKEGFFPGFPWLVRGVTRGIQRVFGLRDDPHDVEGSLVPYLVAGALVNLAATLAALVLLVLLARAWFGPEVAARAGVVVAVMPFSFLLSAFMSEPLFLACSLAAFVAAGRDRFGLAGLAGFGAAMTRVFGVALLLPLFVMALRSAQRERRLENVLFLALVPIGLAVALLAMGASTGNPWIYFEVQQNYGHEDFPSLSGITELFVVRTWLPWEAVRDGLHVVLLAAVVALAARLVRAARAGRGSLVLPLWVVLVLSLPTFAGHLISLPRYTTVAFPLFLSVADLVPGGRKGFVLASVSVLLQLVFFVGFLAHLPVVI